jgi:hypothetical protein
MAGIFQMRCHVDCKLSAGTVSKQRKWPIVGRKDRLGHQLRDRG